MKDIISITGAFAGIFTLIILTITLYKSIMVNKSSYLLTLDKYFAEDKAMQKIYTILSDNNSSPELCCFDEVSSSELSTYLTFVENLHNLIKNNIIKKEELFCLFGHRIFSALHNKEIQEKGIKEYEGHYKNLFIMHKILFLYCIKKGENIPYMENASYFIKESNGDYKKDYKKYEVIIESKIIKAIEANKKRLTKSPVFMLNKNISYKIKGCYIKLCCQEDYPEIIGIQDDIMNDLIKNQNDKLFIPTPKDKVRDFLKQEDVFFICVQTPQNGICAYSYTFFDNKNEYDLSYNFDNKKVATFDTVVVLPDFRGNSLHDELLKISIEEAKKRCYDTMAATVSPDNIHSINNFKKNGFEVLKIIENTKPYEGHKRYVMYKNLI